ncbi:MAG: hypothetical protein ACFN4V_06880, partial [Prevotella denticola]
LFQPHIGTNEMHKLLRTNLSEPFKTCAKIQKYLRTCANKTEKHTSFCKLHITNLPIADFILPTNLTADLA